MPTQIKKKNHNVEEVRGQVELVLSFYSVGPGFELRLPSLVLGAVSVAQLVAY